MKKISQTIILSFITLLLTQPLLATNTATCLGKQSSIVVYAENDQKGEDDAGDGKKGEKESEAEPDCD